MIIKAIKDIEPEGCLSCSQPRSARPRENRRAGERSRARPVGVLVIEDARLMRKAMELGLREQGFLVWTASDGEQGVDLYQLFWTRIDIVLSDVEMPVLDGPKTVDVLREINPSVRFCFMTGDTRPPTLNSLMSRGALRVFSKPLPSLAGVAEELWELATHSRDAIRCSEGGNDEAAISQRTEPSQAAKSKRDVIMGWACSPLFQLLVRIRLLLRKTRSEPQEPSSAA